MCVIKATWFLLSKSGMYYENKQAVHLEHCALNVAYQTLKTA